MDIERLKRAAAAAVAVLRGERLEPVRAVLPAREVVSYAHIDKASPYGRAIEGLSCAVSQAHVAARPQQALEILADALDSTEASTLVTGRPTLLVAALREAAAGISERRWGYYIDQQKALQEGSQ